MRLEVWRDTAAPGWLSLSDVCTRILLPEVWHWKYPHIEPSARQSSLPINPLQESCSLKHNSSGTISPRGCVDLVVWCSWLFWTVDHWECVSFVWLLVQRFRWSGWLGSVRPTVATAAPAWGQKVFVTSWSLTDRRRDAFTDLLSSPV